MSKPIQYPTATALRLNIQGGYSNSWKKQFAVINVGVCKSQVFAIGTNFGPISVSERCEILRVGAIGKVLGYSCSELILESFLLAI